MTKIELIDLVAERCKMPAGSTSVAVETFFKSLVDALVEGRRVEVRGFGSFQVKEYDGYMGRNPRTGDPVSVPPKRLPVFKVGKCLQRAVDGGRNV